MTYLDSAATTLQKPPAVIRAMVRAAEEMSSPGRGGYPSARLAADTVFRCRQVAAELFEVDSPERVVFTFNATHALNLAIRSLVKPGDTVLVSGYEHNAVTRVLEDLGVTVKIVSSPLFEPEVFLREFRQQLTSEVKCVISTHVSNVFGYILPVEEMARECAVKEIPFIVDASQSAGCIPISMKRLGAAFLAMPGHKGLYGPQGTGLLLCGGEANPLLFGGTGSVSLSQKMPDFLPDRLEAGTHNVCGIAGLLEGIRYVKEKGTQRIFSHEQHLLWMAAERLFDIKGVEVFAASVPGRQSGVLSFRVAGKDCEEVGEFLAQHGIAVRAGLHCAPYAHRSAGTLESGTVRASFSAFSEWKDVAHLAKTVALFAGKKA